MCVAAVVYDVAGEIGSLGGSTHLHGFTCAAAVLRAVTPAEPPTPSPATSSSSSSTIADSSSSSSSTSSSSSSSSEAAGSGRLEPGEDRG
mgnify:CR=1 FL=1